MQRTQRWPIFGRELVQPLPRSRRQEGEHKKTRQNSSRGSRTVVFDTFFFTILTVHSSRQSKSLSFVLRPSLYVQNPPRCLRTVVFDNFSSRSSPLSVSSFVVCCLQFLRFSFPLLQSERPRNRSANQRRGKSFQFRPSEQSHPPSSQRCQIKFSEIAR